jgi:uronate dehydrogenase
MHRVLITGAAGGLGTRLRALLRGAYPILRLSDARPLGPAAPGEETMSAELGDLAALERLCQGVDGIVHLGGMAVESDWETILAANIVGSYNLFEAARRQGARRVVYASSNHAVGFYRRDQRIGTNVSPLPDSRYGAAKAMGEALGALYAHKYGLQVLCIRIGNVAERPMNRRFLSLWQSPRDFAQLVRIGLEHPALKYEIVYGVSRTSRSWYDNAAAERLGYAPEDDADAWAEAVLAADPPSAEATPAELYQGGPFVAAERGGDPTKPPHGTA